VEITLPNLAIRAISAALPQKSVSLLSLFPQEVHEDIARIQRSTGIQSVRMAENETTFDLCLAAGKHLLNHSAKASDIGGIVVVTQTPTHRLPAMSVMLQEALGLSQQVVAFDIAYGCSGYVYGLYQAALLIHSGSCKQVLVLSGDVITPYLSSEDRNTRLVLGDGASATLVEKGQDSFSFVMGCDGAGAHHLSAPINDTLFMNGMEVMNFALREVPPMVSRLRELKQWAPLDVTLYGLHQANAFMLHYLTKVMQLDKEKVPVAVDHVGNTGPASIPLMLSLNKKIFLQTPSMLEKVILCGFGTGLSWAGVALSLAKALILAPVDRSLTPIYFY
jgi:3-oxoacyl-[acyl-carrier-protein] synthase-3